MTIAEYKQQVPKKNSHPESILQTKICKQLRKDYAGIMFISDFAAGLYFKEDWIKNLRSLQSCDDKYPDLTILRRNKTFGAIIIEIKCNTSDLFLVDGKRLKSSHVQEQYNGLLKLRGEGYYADFGVGFEDCMGMIKNYMEGVPNDYKEILPFRGKMSNFVDDSLLTSRGL